MQFPLCRCLLVRLNEARVLGKVTYGPSSSFPSGIQVLNKCLSARIKNLYGILSVHIRVTLSSDSNVGVLVVSERFLERATIVYRPDPGEGPNFGGMQQQSLLKTLRHSEYSYHTS